MCFFVQGVLILNASAWPNCFFSLFFKALPEFPRNTPIKCEVDLLSGSRGMRRTDHQRLHASSVDTHQHSIRDRRLPAKKNNLPPVSKLIFSPHLPPNPSEASVAVTGCDIWSDQRWLSADSAQQELAERPMSHRQKKVSSTGHLVSRRHSTEEKGREVNFALQDPQFKTSSAAL